MHRNPTPHTWMHWNHLFCSKCIGITPLTHECTEIVTPQENAPESYPSHMMALKSSSLKYMHRNHTPHTWMHRNRHSSGKYTGILPLIHECTEIVIPQVNTPKSYPSHMNASHKSHSSKCTGILPLTHERSKIVIPQVNAPESYPSHIDAPKSSSLK